MVVESARLKLFVLAPVRELNTTGAIVLGGSSIVTLKSVTGLSARPSFAARTRIVVVEVMPIAPVTRVPVFVGIDPSIV